MTLASKINLSVSAALSSALDLVSPAARLSQRYSTELDDGTAAGMADKVFSDTRTLTASSTENLDLAGSLVDALGATITFARVKAIIIHAAAANTNNVLVGGDVTNTFFPMFGAETDSLIIRPGATVALFAGEADAVGYAVTAATADLLKITNSGAGTSVSYDVIIIGASA
jgi:hypothetical protein